jgi:large subunit ribosomal protein L4
MQCILSELARQERLVVVDEFVLDAPKTKSMKVKLDGLDLKNVLIVTDEQDTNVELSARNLPFVDTIEAGQIDPLSLVSFEKVLVTVPALKKIEEALV